MFKTAPVTEPAPVVEPSSLIPLSHLQLDHPEPAEGWPVYLGRRGIAFRPDHIGRDAISAGDAQRLLFEHREAELKRQRHLKAVEAEAVERDRQFRESLPHGVSWVDMPPGIHPAAAMLAVDEDSRVSVREQLLQQELAHLSSGADS